MKSFSNTRLSILPIAALSLLLSLSTHALSSNKLMPKIIGGEKSQLNDYPFMTGLSSANTTEIDVYCGASYIGGRYVLTAAHCVIDEQAENIDVWIGGNDISKPYQGQRISVHEIYLHEEYDAIGTNKDIAILELEEEVTGVTPLKLLTSSIEATINEGELFTIVGWGNVDDNSENGVYPLILHETQVPLYNREACLAAFSEGEITEFMMCAGFVEGGKDTCQGDSGGPLLYQYLGEWYQAGVVSFGYGCALANSPGIYSRVSTFINWIEQKKEGVSYRQNQHIGFVESTYTETQTITISNITGSPFNVSNVQLQDVVNLVNLTILSNECAGIALADQQSCNITVETTPASFGESAFTLHADTNTALATKIALNVSLQSIPQTAIDMSTATGSDAEFLTWFSGGDAEWQLQTNRASDGGSSVSSGNITDLESSVLLAKITNPLVKSLTFKYLVSAEVGYDPLNIIVNGDKINSFLGTDSSMFSTSIITLTPGINRIAFIFEKDETISDADDRAYIDGISLDISNSNPNIIINATSLTVEEETTFTLDATGTSDVENHQLSFNWSVVGNAAAIIDSANEISTLITAPQYANTSSMTIRLTVSDSFGGSTQRDVIVNISQNPSNIIVSPPNTNESSSGGSLNWFALLYIGLVLKLRKHRQVITNSMKAKASIDKLSLTALCIICVHLLSACTSSIQATSSKDLDISASDTQTSMIGDTENSDQEQDLDKVNIISEVKLAEVYNVEIKDDFIRFLTKSNGCTSAHNFALGFSQSTDKTIKETRVSIHLLKPDYCKARTRIIAIKMPLDLEKIGPIVITNPKRDAPKLNKPRS